jgi:maltose alpha-D-glucosyltransferase/alpha-amylase
VAIFAHDSTGINPRSLGGVNRPAQESWARYWYVWASAAFLRGYLGTVDQSPLLLQTRDEFRMLLDAYLLERALHELHHELNERPEWVIIPLQGILHLLASRPSQKQSGA